MCAASQWRTALIIRGGATDNGQLTTDVLRGAFCQIVPVLCASVVK
jgi:hypothetical protein